MNTYSNESAIPPHPTLGKISLLLAGLGGLLLLGWLVWQGQMPLLLIAALGLPCGILVLKKPDTATFIFVFVFYSNLAVVAHKFHGVPQVVAAAVPLLLVLPLASYWFVKRERPIITTDFILLCIYLSALIVSSFMAKDSSIALSEIVNFLTEGLILYFLVINVIRDLPTVKRVLYTLMLACALMGGITLFQEVTHTYNNSYGGMAQRKADIDVGSVDFDEYSSARRASGSIGEKNRFGQVLLVILPLSLYVFYLEPRGGRKWLAAGLSLLSLAGIILTFSRGTFVILVAMVFPILYWRYVKLGHAVLAVLGLAFFVGLFMPEYFERMSGLDQLTSLSSQSNEVRNVDGSLRGRYAENMAALGVFLDYPLLGVGPGQFPAFYVKKYGNEVGTKFLENGRRAHNLYLEIAAEIGIFGLISFLAIIFWIAFKTWKMRLLCLENRSELAHMTTAFLLSLFAYLGTGVFLHLSFQRYFWFLLALISAGVRVIELEVSQNEAQKLRSV